LVDILKYYYWIAPDNKPLRVNESILQQRPSLIDLLSIRKSIFKLIA